MKKSKLWVAGVPLLVLVAFFAGRALATGAPAQTPLTWTGTVTDPSGTPYANAVEVTVAFYDSAVSTSPKCVSPSAQAEANTGHFSVVLPPECAQAVHDTPDLWSEATVGADKAVLPRVHVGAVPFALEANSAKQADSATIASTATQAQGATGALLTTIDQLKSDVAALKSAGGTTALSVYDKNNVKLGQLLGVSHKEDFSSTAYHNIDVLEILTSAGYFVELVTDPTNPNPAVYAPVYGAQPTSIAFSNKGCTGSAGIWTANSQSVIHVLNRRVFYLLGKLYVPDGPIDSVTMATKYMTTQSSVKAGALCSDYSAASSYYLPLKEVSPTDIGLPATTGLPLRIAP